MRFIVCSRIFEDLHKPESYKYQIQCVFFPLWFGYLYTGPVVLWKLVRLCALPAARGRVLQRCSDRWRQDDLSFYHNGPNFLFLNRKLHKNNLVFI